MLGFLLLLLLIGAGLRWAGAQIPILDYPLGGPMAQPRIVMQQPATLP
jgi:Na+/citrate or Na+/malate symporter